MPKLKLEKLKREIHQHELFQTWGSLRSSAGLLRCTLQAAVGEQCAIVTPSGSPVLAEVIGFSDGLAHIAAYEEPEAVRPGMQVIGSGRALTVPVGQRLLGRVLDGLARPIDGQGPIAEAERVEVQRTPPSPMERVRIREPFVTGQRAIDGLLTFGRGQRVGIFAGSGVGKTTLLGEIAKGSNSDVNVIALIGERGREVRPFLEDVLGTEGLRRSVVVVATSDQTPLFRVRAAQVAITLASYFRDRGAHVLFILDSLTRMAMAQRELGLSLGEPPSARGYTPSVYSLLASTAERLGNSAHGSITGVLAVLVDGDDLDEPISDASRSLLDGHIVLDRRLAERGHFPAIHVGRSISRIARDVTDSNHQHAARQIRAILATYAEAEDLIRIGAYVRGSSPMVDRAVELLPQVEAFLRQEQGEWSTLEETRARMERIAAGWTF